MVPTQWSVNSSNSKSKEDIHTKHIQKFNDRPGSSAKSLNRKPLKVMKVPYYTYILLLFHLTFPTNPGYKSRSHTMGSCLNCSIELFIGCAWRVWWVQSFRESSKKFRGRTTENLPFYGLRDKYWGCDYTVLFRNYTKVWTSNTTFQLFFNQVMYLLHQKVKVWFILDYSASWYPHSFK